MSSVALKDYPNATFNGFTKRLRPNEECKAKIAPKFIGYFFRTKEFRNVLTSIASMTTRASLNNSMLNTLQIPIPPLSEQKAIASVLSSLDDKIDLLHRQNKTLEAMAETLFRQWFVEEVQDDWEERRLGEFFPVLTGKRDANYSTEDGEFPFFTCSMKHLMSKDYSFNASAILLSGNGDFNIKRYSGKFEAYQRTYVLIPSNIKYFNILYVLMKFSLQEITGGYRGSVINFLTKGMIENFTFLIPSSPFDEKIKHVDDIFYKIDINIQHLHTLEKLRNNLLPKLMSGEVRVNYE